MSAVVVVVVYYCILKRKYFYVDNRSECVLTCFFISSFALYNDLQFFIAIVALFQILVASFNLFDVTTLGEYLTTVVN